MIKELSLPCHYKVRLNTENNSYEFNTAGGAIYGVFFESENSIFSGTVLEGADTFHLVVTKLQSGDGVKDIHVSKTLDSIVEHFFLIKNRIIFYTCDGSDDRHLARDRMFKIWYSNSPHHQRLNKYDFEFAHEEIKASVIFDKANDLGEQEIFNAIYLINDVLNAK